MGGSKVVPVGTQIRPPLLSAVTVPQSALHLNGCCNCYGVWPTLDARQLHIGARRRLR
jgi:hypothetical protein